MLTLYLFALLTVPQSDLWICDLWTKQLTTERVLSACGTLAIGNYRVELYDVETLKLLCTRPATELAQILNNCNLPEPLDLYVIRLINPKQNQTPTILCYVTSPTTLPPAADEINAQCPDAINTHYTLHPAGTKQIPTEEKFTCPIRSLTTGYGLYDQAISPSGLFTDRQLHILSGKLIWHGLATANCDGSGLDPTTLAANACGMSSTRDLVIRWQNQFNQEIYDSAIKYNIPAHLLKRMMMIESQFWPLWESHSGDGEIGIMQITDNGLDALYRFDPDADPFYMTRTDEGKFWSRSLTRDTLYCHGCNMEKIIQHIKQTIIPLSARLLAAYHCRAVTINPGLNDGTNDAWRQAVVDYNGSAEYLTRIESQ